jgi:hypothetical protein
MFVNEFFTTEDSPIDNEMVEAPVSTIGVMGRINDLVSMESFSIGNMSDLVHRTFPKLVGEAQRIISSVFTGSTVEFKLSSKQGDFVELVRKHNYMDLKTIKVYAPMGMKPQYIPILDVFLYEAQFCEDLLEYLHEYVVLLSRIVTDENFVTSGSYVAEKPKLIEEQLTDITKHRAGLEDPKYKQPTVEYKDIVHNNSEWEGVFDKLNKVMPRYKGMANSKVKQKLDEASNLLGVLLKKQSNKKLDHISPEVYNGLTHYTFVMAKALERYSLIQFQFEVFQNCLQKTVERVQGILKN